MSKVVLCGSLVVALLAVCTVRADACACCDAITSRELLGWSEAGGAVLIEMSTNAACQELHVLEIVPVGATAASGCYDLYGDPEKRIACADATSPVSPSQKPKRSTKVQRFPRAATQLPAARIKITTKTDVRAANRAAKTHLTVKIDGRRVLEEALDEVRGSVAITAWPNPREDRALLLIRYVDRGSGDQRAVIRWVELAARTTR